MRTLCAASSLLFAHPLAALVTFASASTACSSPATNATASLGSSTWSGTSCSGDPTLCLSGTLTATRFSAASQGGLVTLFSTFPGENALPIGSLSAGLGSTFAFSGLRPGVDYYLQAEVQFDTVNVVTRIVGPFEVADAGAVQLDLLPIALDVLETVTGEGTPMLESASATLYDPTTGAQIDDGGLVELVLPDASLSLALDAERGVFLYVPPAPMAVPLVYAVTATPPGAGVTPSRWQLTATRPSGVPIVVSLASAPPGALPDAGTVGPVIPGDASPDAALFARDELVVTFSGPPDSDYIQLELFESTDAGWSAEYQSPAPLPATATQSVVNAACLPDTTTYLIDVLAAKVNCALSAAGCVQVAAVASQEFVAAPLPDGG